MSLLSTPEYSTRRFTWSAETRTFSAEASDFTNAAGPTLGRVYDDACDEGFTLISQWTNQRMPLRLREIIREDGDVLGWIYEPVTQGRRTNLHPVLPAFKVVIFND
jgi:hypothetical protein